MSETGTFEIRAFQPSDQNGVLSLAVEVLCREFRVRENLEQEDDLQEVASAYLPPDNVFFVALRDKKVVGTGAIVRLSDRDCEVRRLYVHPEYRRQGIGSAMAASLLGFVRERGYRRVLLERLPELQYSLRAYARYGLNPVADPEDLPRSGEFVAIQL